MPLREERRRRRPRIGARLRGRSRRAVDREQEALAEDEVDLGRLDLAAVLEREQDDVDHVVVGRDLRPLVALRDVLGDQRVQPEVARRRRRRVVGRGRSGRPRRGCRARRPARRAPSRSSISATPDGDQQTIRTGADSRGVSPRPGASSVGGSEGDRGPSLVASIRLQRDTRRRAPARRRAVGGQHTRPRAPPRARPGGIATIVTTPATRNIPTRISDASPAAQASSASTTKRVAQRPVAQLLRDDRLPAVGDREELVVEAVDRRRAVRGQDRDADRHADHPGDGHDRAGHPERRPAGASRPRPSTAASRSARTRPRRPPRTSATSPIVDAGVQRDIQSSAPAD